jgi:uncharacterized membrane protein
MVLLYGLLTALFIVTGQALWKLAVQNAGKSNANIVSIDGATKVITSWPLLLGVVVYGIATIAYIYFLSKYKYFQIQSIVVGCSLVLTLLISTVFFKEQADFVNMIGVGFILVGALLVIR